MAHDDDLRTPDEHAGERLAAYLAGDLDEVRTRAVERELEQDPARREELERIHQAVLRLRRVDEIAVPDGLADRVRARVREEEQTRAARAPAAPTPRTALAPWWRRPIAAVAALGLLAVVALSTVVGVGGGADEASRQVFSADGGEEAAADAAAAEEGAGPTEAAGGAVPEAAMQPEGGAELRGNEFAAATAAQGELFDAGDLSDPAARAAFLTEVRDDPEVAAVLDGDSRPPGWVAGVRAALQAEGVGEDCIRTLLADIERRPVVALRADVDGRTTVGVVGVAGEALHLVLVEPAASCAVVVEQQS